MMLQAMVTTLRTKALSGLWRSAVMMALPILAACAFAPTESQAFEADVTDLSAEDVQVIQDSEDFLRDLRAEMMQQRSLEADSEDELGIRSLASTILPAFEYELPFAVPFDHAGWLETQQKLFEHGFYSDQPDGIPGPKTYNALMAYMERLEQILVDRVHEAMTRGKASGPWSASEGEQNYGILGDRAGEFKSGATGSYAAHSLASYAGNSYYDGNIHKYYFEALVSNGATEMTCFMFSLNEIGSVGHFFVCPFLGGQIWISSIDRGGGFKSGLSLNIDGRFEDIIERPSEFGRTQIPLPTED